MAFPEYMSAVEADIVSKIIHTALDKGFKISIHDGEEWALIRCVDYEAITKEVAATDTTELVFRDVDNNRLGGVFLVHGNDEDVVCDHTDNQLMKDLVS